MALTFSWSNECQYIKLDVTPLVGDPYLANSTTDTDTHPLCHSKPYFFNTYKKEAIGNMQHLAIGVSPVYKTAGSF